MSVIKPFADVIIFGDGYHQAMYVNGELSIDVFGRDGITIIDLMRVTRVYVINFITILRFTEGGYDWMWERKDKYPEELSEIPKEYLKTT